MSAEHILLIAQRGVFHPRKQFGQLAADHVPFDRLVGRNAFESRALAAVTSGPVCVGVLGPIGGGKSSLIAHVCANLPESHVALRVPVVGADDPTSVSDLAAMTLATALHDIDMEAYQRDALASARADELIAHRAPTGLTGGTLGGGPIPAQARIELGSLHEELRMNRLAGERLFGLDRLVSVLAAQGRDAVFVLEDTEAAIGGAEPEAVEAFFAGPVRAFIHEVEAATLVAVQDHLARGSRAFGELQPSIRLVEIPHLDDAHSHRAIRAIVDHRLAAHDIPGDADTVLGDDALDPLIVFYDESGRSLPAHARRLAVCRRARGRHGLRGRPGWPHPGGGPGLARAD